MVDVPSIILLLSMKVGLIQMTGVSLQKKLYEGSLKMPCVLSRPTQPSLLYFVRALLSQPQTHWHHEADKCVTPTKIWGAVKGRRNAWAPIKTTLCKVTSNHKISALPPQCKETWVNLDLHQDVKDWRRSWLIKKSKHTKSAIVQ